MKIWESQSRRGIERDQGDRVCHFQFCPYSRRFRSPFLTRSGIYASRQGLILRLESEEQVGYGEIAPLPWFPGETFDQALKFCQDLPAWIGPETIATIPAHLPATQFGLESAWTNLHNLSGADPELEAKIAALPQAGLLPQGRAALSTWQSLWEKGYRTLKWKVGRGNLRAEIEILQELCQVLPPEVRLRLDANGQFDQQRAKAFLTVCDRLPIEFLEQPLPPAEFTTLRQLAAQHSTPLALDESVATLTELKQCYNQGWRGLVILKAAIAGYPSQLRAFCQDYSLNLVFSSAFETAIGRRAALALAAELANPHLALGFGVQYWLEEAGLETSEFDRLWHHLCTTFNNGSTIPG